MCTGEAGSALIRSSRILDEIVAAGPRQSRRPSQIEHGAKALPTSGEHGAYMSSKPADKIAAEQSRPTAGCRPCVPRRGIDPIRHSRSGKMEGQSRPAQSPRDV